jgi:hypothetical protein
MGDRGGILVYIASSSSLGSNFVFSLWIKVGANTPPKTYQKYRQGSCIIRRLSFAVVPQDRGYPLSFPHSSVVTYLVSLSTYEDIIHRLEGSVQFVHGCPPNIVKLPQPQLRKPTDTRTFQRTLKATQVRCALTCVYTVIL